MRWRQWNRLYRDTLQRFVHGDSGVIPDLMTQLYGSSDIFPDDSMHTFRPFQSVNYITSYDDVSYNHKHNRANDHNNTDRHDDLIWSCG